MFSTAHATISLILPNPTVKLQSLNPFKDVLTNCQVLLQIEGKV